MKTTGIASLPSQQSKAARRQRARAQGSRLWKASMRTIAGEGEGAFGAVGVIRKGGKGRGVKVCMCRSVSIVVGMLGFLKSWAARPAAGLSTLGM